jgi:hypothetical protein
MYAVSEAGRRRFESFAAGPTTPFVERRFRTQEIEVVGTEPVVVVASTTTAGLLMSFRRAFRGNRAMDDGPSKPRAETSATSVLVFA